MIGKLGVQKEEAEAKKRVLKALPVGTHKESGSRPHLYICHRGEVGQNYLDFSGPAGLPFSGFWAAVEGDGDEDNP